MSAEMSAEASSDSPVRIVLKIMFINIRSCTIAWKRDNEHMVWQLQSLQKEEIYSLSNLDLAEPKYEIEERTC